MGPWPQGQEPDFLRTRSGRFRRTWGRVHRDRNRVSSGSTVEASGGLGAAVTPIGAWPLQDHCGEFGDTWSHIHRDRSIPCEKFGRMWGCVHVDRSPASSGSAVGDSGGRGGGVPRDRNPVSSGPVFEASVEHGLLSTGTRAPQDPLRRFREDAGPAPRPQRQQLRLLRTRCGRSR